MRTSPCLMLGAFNLGSGEIILVLATLLIMFWANHLPRIGKWLWRDGAREAGRSIRGIYGRRAFQPLTPDNKVAELYRPKTLHPKHGYGGTGDNFCNTLPGYGHDYAS